MDVVEKNVVIGMIFQARQKINRGADAINSLPITNIVENM